MQRFNDGQRVFVKQDEDGRAVNRHGEVTRICTDGERAWVQLDAKGGGKGSDKVRAYPDDCEPSDEANRAERRSAAREEAKPPPTLETFGKDHWSTFAYIETRIVDHRGEPNREQMRCHADRHPMLVGRRNGDGSAHPTILKGGVELKHHDDWDCIDDLIREGLLLNVGSAVNPVYKLTALGRAMASKLRAHKGNGGNFAAFLPVAERASP